MQRGDWRGSTPSDKPADQANAWKKQTAICEHELPGTARQLLQSGGQNAQLHRFGLERGYGFAHSLSPTVRPASAVRSACITII